jgi:plastocyanin
LPPERRLYAVSDHGAALLKGTRASIEAGDFFFSPTCQTQAPPAGTLTLVVHNGGQALHNVSVPAQGIDTDVEAGQTVTVSVKAGATPFTFFCKYHRTSGMVGAVIPTGT